MRNAQLAPVVAEIINIVKKMSDLLVGRIKDWRYNCPLCEGHDIYKNTAKEPQTKQYYCMTCNSQIEKVHDKKENKRVG